MKKKDFIFLIILGIILILFYIIWTFINNKNGSAIEIWVDSKLYETYSLDEEIKIPIKANNHIGNTLFIENGYAYMQEADCPDKTCMRQGKINKDGESIVCLPHRIVIKVISSEESEIDTMVK